MDIGKRVIMLALFEIDRVEDFQAVAILQKCVAALNDNASFRERFVKIKYGKCEIQCLKLQIYLCSEHFLTNWLYTDGL